MNRASLLRLLRKYNVSAPKKIILIFTLLLYGHPTHEKKLYNLCQICLLCHK